MRLLGIILSFFGLFGLILGAILEIVLRIKRSRAYGLGHDIMARAIVIGLIGLIVYYSN